MTKKITLEALARMINEGFNGIESRMATKEEVKLLADRLDAVESRLGAVETRLSTVEGTLDNVVAEVKLIMKNSIAA